MQNCVYNLEPVTSHRNIVYAVQRDYSRLHIPAFVVALMLSFQVVLLDALLGAVTIALRE